MNAVVDMKTGQKPKPNMILIEGRCIGGRKVPTREGHIFSHVIAIPAPDVYSHPQAVEVTSEVRLCGKGDEFSGLCRLGGAIRHFKYMKDGEQVPGYEWRGRLTFVEDE